MIEPLIIITNNPLSNDNFSDKYTVIFIDGNVEQVYETVRDKIHLGYKLLTHPLMSSVKPNETPYRTICISKEKFDKVDFDSLQLIENSIMALKKFLNNAPIPKYTMEVLYDFQVIDYDLIHHALN
jgi:hypothetical protein